MIYVQAGSSSESGAPRRAGGAIGGLCVGAAILLATLVGAAPATADAIAVRDSIYRASAPELRVEDDRLLLALDEAIAIALERNLSLHVQRFVREEARFGILQSMGIYDVNGRATLSSFEETAPTASVFGGADVLVSEGQSWNFGVDQLVPSGGTFSADWNNRRDESNSRFSSLNPSFRIDLDVSYLQPLLRSRGRSATERGIRIARTNLDISAETFETQVVGTIQQVQDAYWNLVEAQAQLGVAEESLELAKQLHEQNRVRVEVGTLAPLELVQSEAGVASREEQVIRSRAGVGDAEDLLRQLLHLEDVWEVPIVPETEPETERLALDLEESIRTALGERPELRSKRLSLSNQEVDAEYFQNQKLPRLDLSVVYGLNAIGGDFREIDFVTGQISREVPGGYGDAVDQITGIDFDGWSVALNLAYPLQNRSARAQSAIADVALERGQAELRDLELGVRTEVRRLYRFVETAGKVIDSARASRILEEKNLDAEQKRYQNGMSTSFQVLQIQEDLTEARSREVSAITGYRKAVALFHQATGRLMEASGVELVAE